MTIKTKIVIIMAVILIIFPIEQLLADECDRENYAEETYFLMLAESLVTGCFDYEINKTKLGNDVRAILVNSNFNIRTRALKALQAISNHIKDTYLVPTNEEQDNAKIITDAIEVLEKRIENSNMPDKKLKSDWQWDSADQPPQGLSRLDFKKYLPEDKCKKVKENNCGEAYLRAEDLGRSIMLINAAIDRYTEKYREEAEADRKLRRKKWDSYYDDLTFQYFWELLANNALLEHYDDRAVIEGNKIGFRSLPKSKLVLIHPEVNLAYNDKANDKFDETVTVEFVGYEGFKFDDKGKVKNPWGISVLAAYMNSPEDGDADWTFGLLFKYDGYSFGVTDNDGEVAVVLNFNLSQKLLTIKDKYRRYYDEYNDRLEKLSDKL